MVTKNDLMGFVRRDGPLNARVVFLSIEDGSDLKTRDNFEEYYGQPESNQAWEPQEPIQPSEDCGFPGVYIPKLMVALLGGPAAAAPSYRASRLYRSDCSNIKYYPIAKKIQDLWPEFLTREDDFGRDEYLARCHSSERHDAILRAHGASFAPDRLFVILGARTQWEAFLASRVFGGERLRVMEEIRNGKLIGRLIGNDQDVLRYCYFWMFRHPPIREPDLAAFAQRVRARAGHVLATIPPLT